MSGPPSQFTVPPPTLSMPPPRLPPPGLPPTGLPPTNLPPPGLPPTVLPPTNLPPPGLPPPGLPPPPPPGPVVYAVPPPPLSAAPLMLPPLHVPPPGDTSFPPPSLPLTSVPPPFLPPPLDAYPPRERIPKRAVLAYEKDYPPIPREERHSRSYDRESERERYYCDRERREYRSRSPSSSHHYSRSPSRHGSSSRYHSRSPPPHSSSSRYGRSPSHHSMSSRHLSRSPSRHSSSSRHRSRSPSHHSSDRERYYREKERNEREHDRRRYEYERKREMIRRMEHERRHSPHREHRSHSRSVYDERHHERSPSRHSRCSPSRSHSHRPSSSMSRREREIDPNKPMSDREKILEEFKKNYCPTSEDFIQKVEKWSKEQEEESQRMWYRSSPAELHYMPVPNSSGLQQTPKLEKLCSSFKKNLIDRGRNARPEVDELPPLKPPKAKMCKHKLDEKSSSSSTSSESEEELLDEDGLQGYTDRIMLELQRKQNHPRRLHPEMWFNNTGEMNGGPLCRCSARARRHGMRHGVYAGEGGHARCDPCRNNLDRLYHYRITVSPPTNFLIKSPTIIGHDEHEFLFSGFSMFSHYKLSELPTCKVIRFNIEYTILYVEEPAPTNFTVHELDLFEEFLFYELLELIDLDLGKPVGDSCSQFHFMPRFVRFLPESGCEVLSMCEVLKYILDESGLLIPSEMLKEVHEMDHYTWQRFVDRIKGMIVCHPGRKPCSVRVDQLDRSPPAPVPAHSPAPAPPAPPRAEFYPEIVHFGIRPPQLSYAGNPEYQKAWRYYVKYRHLVANMAKPSYKERQKLAAKEANLQEMRTQNKMKRDVTVAISSEGFHTTGLMCDVVQHAMLIPVLVRHLRFHKSLESLERNIGYVFKQRALLQTALTHPSYRENFGTNPDHARNSLTNCGIRQPEYGDRRIHYTRKKGIVTLISIMSRFGKPSETESAIKHNERLEFLGDAVVEFLSSIHLFSMFPGLAEGGLATFRAAIVQNQHLAQLAKNIGLEQYMLYAHGSDLCRDVVMRHAMANCFEALMGALFIDGGVEVADRVFSLALWHSQPSLLEVWCKPRAHPLQEQEPLGDRKYVRDFHFLRHLTQFEDSIGVQFKHIRLLARSFTDRSVGFTHLTLGSNQRLEFLGDTVLQLVVSDRLYRHFPDHHEGHLSLLRSSLVNNRTQAMVCDDLNMSEYAIYNNPKAKPTTKKHKADLLEAFLGALYIDKNLEYCQAFCNACLFPRLQEFIMNQDWNDPKSKLQQCCLTLRSMEGGEPDIPLYKVVECLGPTNTRVYTVAVYFRGRRLAAARGHSIQEAEMNAAEEALNTAHELFPQLDHQKRVIAASMKHKRGKRERRTPDKSLRQKKLDEQVPKAYRLHKQSDSDSDSTVAEPSDDDNKSDNAKSDDDSGLDSDESDKHENIKVSSLLSDMEKIKKNMISTNAYDKLKEKCRKSDSDDD